MDRKLLPVKRVPGREPVARPGATSQLKLPVALDSARALFVYADPGHDTATALRSWGTAHRAPVARAREAETCPSEVVAVARTARASSNGPGA